MIQLKFEKENLKAYSKGTDTTMADIEVITELSEYEKKKKLYRDQKKLLDTFLEHGAISKAQYDKSLGDMTEKMGMGDVMEA